MRHRGSCAVFFVPAMLCLLGCDIVQGFRAAEDALFPAEKAYLDAPGLRLVSGGYRRVHFAKGAEIYLVMRSADDDDQALYALPFADPAVCSIPDVGEYSPGAGTFKGPSIIAYFSAKDGVKDGVGTLRFADATCRTYDYTIPSPTLPFLELEAGFVVLTGTDFVLVDPVAGTALPLVTSVENLYPEAVPGFDIVQAAGTLKAFPSDWTAAAAQTFGSGVKAAGYAGTSFFFEDSGGIHRLTSSGGDTPSVVNEIVAPDGCSLVVAPWVGGGEIWATYLAPCSGGRFTAYGASATHASKLDVPQVAQRVALVPAWPAANGDPATDPFYVFYLTDFDDSVGVGTLFLRGPDKKDYPIGARAALERITVVESETSTYGYALLDVNGDTGRYVRWQASDGSTVELADGVWRWGDDLLVHYDGSTGDLALASGGALTVVAKSVPAAYFKFRDSKNRYTGLLHDYDGSVAVLSTTESTLDRNEAAQAVPPLAAPVLTTVATNVAPDGRARFLGSLPGIAYVAGYDPQRDTGRLDYQNLELEFTATVSDGVQNYLSTKTMVIYSVPSGAAAGIWVVRAR